MDQGEVRRRQQAAENTAKRWADNTGRDTAEVVERYPGEVPLVRMRDAVTGATWIEPGWSGNMMNRFEMLGAVDPLSPEGAFASMLGGGVAGWAPKGALAANAIRRASPGQTVTNPMRRPAFQIYDDPREMVGDVRLAPESPNLKKVFGVTRGDLAEMNQGRVLEVDPRRFLKYAANPKGSAHAKKIMNPRNAQRIHDVLEEAGKIPELKAMDDWYTFDPVYGRLVRLHGKERGAELGDRLNNVLGAMSPNSEVIAEIRRGLWVNHLLHKFGDKKTLEMMMRHGGKSELLNKAGFLGVPGHLRNKAHASGVGNFVSDRMYGKPKVPSYIWASGRPGINKQTFFPVGDAHFSRGIGLADVRGAADYDAAWKMPEAISIAPWWRGIVQEHGIDSVPGQARLWGALGKRTGVKSPIGASKTELLADVIADRWATRWRNEGLSLPETRDRILSGELYSAPATPSTGFYLPTDDE